MVLCKNTFNILVRDTLQFPWRNKVLSLCQFSTVPSTNLGKKTKKLDLMLQNAEKQKILKVAIIGVPNAGKSTLINQLVDRTVVAMSRKAHTTRCKARAVYVQGDTQIVYLDTPGAVSASDSAKFRLEKSFLADGEDSVDEADVIGVVHDVSNGYTRNKIDASIQRLLHLYEHKESFLVLNKIDTIKTKRILLDIATTLTGGKLRKCHEQYEWVQKTEKAVREALSKKFAWTKFSDVFMISAFKGEGVTQLKEYLLSAAHPGEWLFDKSSFTDQNDVDLIQNTVKSKLLEYLPNEIPYKLQVELEYLDKDQEDKIRAVVLVTCRTERLRRIVTGVNGSTIRLIARESECSLSDTFNAGFHLRLVVVSKSQLNQF